MKSVLSVLSAVLLAAAISAAAEPTANQWTMVDKSGAGGVRIGAAAAWLAKEKQFLVVGGVQVDRKNRFPTPFEIQTYDPAANAWAVLQPAGFQPAGFKGDRADLLTRNDKGQYRLPGSAGISASSVFDPDARQLYVFHTRDGGKVQIGVFDVLSRQWSLIATTKPPGAADGEYPGEWGTAEVFMEGAAVVLDPVNRELLLLGGRTATADDGFVGHWALSLAEVTWRRLTAAAPVLDGLREKCIAAKGQVRNTMSALRNALFQVPKGLDAESAGGPTPVGQGEWLSGAIILAKELVEAAGKAQADGWQADCLARARPLLARALERLEAAQRDGDPEKPDAALVGKVFDAAWALDEAADFLRAAPGPRQGAGACYDPAAKSIVLFGGDHGDYMLCDTWIYDCASRSWRRAVGPVCPEPRRAAGRLVYLPDRKQVALLGGSTIVPKWYYFRRPMRGLSDVWVFDAAAGRWSLVFDGRFPKDAPEPALHNELAVGAGDVVLGLAAEGQYDPVPSTWLFRIAGEASPDAAAKAGVADGARTYFTIVPQYDPRWYDAAADGADPAKAAALLEKLPANQWTAVPEAPRPAPQREWGTAAFDTDRDQFYHWTGGHMADPSSIVFTCHPAINRWHAPYVGEYFGKGFGFNGRPDCMNHTYLNYAYDFVNHKLVCTASGGTGVYDPDRNDFQTRIAQPFSQHPYYTKTVGTPKGVVCWTRGWFGWLDLAARQWKKLPVVGKLPPVVHGDENALTYDPTRNCLWMLACDGYEKPNGRVWRYDLADGKVAEVPAANREQIGMKARCRESVYVPGLDLILYNAIVAGRQLAFDPAKSRWVLAATKPAKDIGGVSAGLMYDPKRKLVWCMCGSRQMFVLRPDPKSLEIGENAGE